MNGCISHQAEQDNDQACQPDVVLKQETTFGAIQRSVQDAGDVPFQQRKTDIGNDAPNEYPHGKGRGKEQAAGRCHESQQQPVHAGHLSQGKILITVCQEKNPLKDLCAYSAGTGS